MNLAPFESVLKRAIGLDAASIGSSAVERAVRSRMNALRCANAEEYARRVEASGEELQELIEAIVVPETWFFRHREAFGALIRFVHEEWSPRHPQEMLRVLSAPCSTGEEPYSIAMALLDAGVPPDRFRVDAIDVSAHALARAQRASYGKNSFRGTELLFRERHFSAAGQRWDLHEAVRRQVRLQSGNLLDPGLLADREPYAVIFCRNLLIYFDRPTQDRAVAALTRLLAPDGMLFIGPSETGLLLDHNFESTRVPLAFAFRKAAPRRPEAKSDGLAPPRKTRPPVPPPSRKPAPARPFASVAATAPAAVATAPVDELEEIAQLANEGHLAEAARRCEAYLSSHDRSARAFYLLGVVRDAAGKHSDAAELYRKALYLDPRHHEALLQLAYLTERAGDATGARVLRERAQRVAKTKG